MSAPRYSPFSFRSLGLIGLLTAITFHASAIPLPDTSTVSSASPALQITNTGTGGGGFYTLNNVGNANYALFGRSNGSGVGIFGSMTGTGQAGVFQINNVANSNYALQGLSNGRGIGVYGYMTGAGRAGYFQIQNPSSSSEALTGVSSGKGISLYSVMSGMGRAAYIQNTNASNPNVALTVVTKGSGSALKGVAGTGLAGEFEGNVTVTGNLKTSGDVQTLGGVKFGDGTTQDSAIHITRYIFILAAGAYSDPITIPVEEPVSLTGICTTPGVRGVGVVSLLRIENQFIEWTGQNSTPSGANVHGFSGITGNKIVQIDFSGGLLLEVFGPDSIRLHNTTTDVRAGKITMTW